MTPLCYKPWDSVFFDEKGRIAPCCEFRPAISKDSFASYISSDELKQVQTALSRNEFPGQCQSCSGREASGVQSLRQKHQQNNTFKDKLKYVELSLDNICNMSCVMCSPDVSQGVAKEYVKLGWIKNVTQYQNYAVLKELETINDPVHVIVTGGEPFMSEKIVPLLELVRQKEWAISISTNCSTVNKKALAVIKDIERVTYQISLDAVDDLYSFLRYPSNWSTFKKTLGYYKRSLKNPTYQSIHFNTVLSILNVHQVQDIFDYAYQNKIDLRVNNLTWPEWLCWDILTNDERLLTLSKLKTVKPRTLSQVKILDSIINHIQSYQYNSNTRISFISKLNQIIKVRNYNQKTMLIWYPELLKNLNLL